MSNLRKQTQSNYTHISNDLLNAEGLSFRARGIAAYLLSKPDNWQVKIPHLMKVGKEGEKAVRTALQELATYGFLMRERIRENNRIVTVTRLADYPAFLHIGTVEERINGYQAQDSAISDIPLSDRSETSSSQKRQVRKGEVLVNTDNAIPDKVVHRQNKKQQPAKPRKSYQPEDYDDL